jgi:hypothetical protein
MGMGVTMPGLMARNTILNPTDSLAQQNQYDWEISPRRNVAGHQGWILVPGKLTSQRLGSKNAGIVAFSSHGVVNTLMVLLTLSWCC